MKKVTVRDLWNYFGYRRLCGDESSLDREIRDININRPGLELSGYYRDARSRIVVFGEKEITYIQMLDEQRQREVFDFLTAERVPMILISRDLPCPPILLEIAGRKNMPVFSSYAHTNSLIVEIMSYLEEELAETESIHGVLLQVYSRGVLITAESGMGKSEVALELISKGHVLVADDRVDVYRAHNRLIGKAPDILRNMLEIRGVGIINVSDMFGAPSTADKAEIDCVIHLERLQENHEYDRIGLDNEQVETIFGIDLPKMVIPVGEGRSIATIIEGAVSNFIMRQKGIDSSKVFDQRVIDFIKHQGGR